MESIIKKVLDTSRVYKGTPIVAVMNDQSARFIQAVICTDGTPGKANANDAVTVTYERADGTSKTFAGSVNADGSVRVPIAAWALTEEGDVWCWITVGNGSSALTTTRFLIEVQYKPNTDGTVTPDDPEYNDIMAILARISEAENNIAANTENLANLTNKQNEDTERLDGEIENINRQVGDNSTSIENINQNVADNALSIQKASVLASGNSKRLSNLESRLGESAFITDDSIAYIKTVPEGALPYAEITKIGGMSYKDDAAGTITDANVTGIGSLGENLFPIKNGVASYSGFTIQHRGDGYYAINGERTATGMIRLRIHLPSLLPVGRYSVSLNNQSIINVSENQKASQEDTVLVWFSVVGNESRYIGGCYADKENNTTTFTADQPIEYAIIRIGQNVLSLDNFVIRPQIEKGRTVTPYKPYIYNALSIPKSVQAIDGYGWGINNTLYNYIDLEKQQFIKRVGRVDMGTLDWKKITPATLNTFSAFVPGIKSAPSYNDRDTDLLCALFTLKKDDLGNMKDKTILRHSASAFVCNNDYSTSAEFKAAMSGVMLYYELEEPVITDISDVLLADNFIGVTVGCTVFAKNANYLDVPTTITYQIKEDVE